MFFADAAILVEGVAESIQIAVITYTNAACDEISRRLHYKSIFSVSTIHSFLWELIKNYQSDIKAWVINSINLEIAELEEKQRKSKTGKTSEKRAEDIRKKQERLAKINTVRRFTYNPNGDNVGYDSLNHSEVVKMGSKFICAEDTMQKAYKGNNDFEVLKIVKEYSPLMESKKWISLDDQTKALQQVESAVDKLMELWKDDAIPTCLDVLRSIQDTGLFKLDERVDNILSSPAADESIRITALRKALSVPFTTLEKYFAYVSDNTRFATHQGVKGLEFPRVMVIIDDAEAKGFLFSYEKLFGVKLKTETDIKNEREGKDNSITRTTRLFYVACTRAQKSLAIIAYTYDCEAVKATAMKNNWFEDDEIRLLE